MSIPYVRTIKPHSAQGLVARVYRQIKRDFGAVVEPFSVHSSVPELLAGVWSACRESLLVGTVAREVKEAVAAAVSRINRCPYCVDAHTILLEAASPGIGGNAIGSGNFRQIRNPAIQSAVMWASASRSPDDENLISPPFPTTEAPEMIGTAVFFHYINRMATVLLSDTPLPLRQAWARGWLKWVASRFFSKAVHRPKEAGASLLLLPEAELPGDLAWSQGASHIAGAFARLARVVDEAGRAEVPADVRERLGERLEVWDGTDPGLGKGWVADAIRGLDEGSKPAGRLAMLTAFAPYQIDDDVMKSFVKGFPGDRTLLVTLAWSSFSAARRIGGWLWAPQMLHHHIPGSAPGVG